MNNIFLIIKRTIEENIKSKSNIIFFIIFVVLFIPFTFVKERTILLSVFKYSQYSIFLLWLYYVIVGLPFFIFIIYKTISSFNKDFKKGVALLLFTRPISRRKYLFGKAIGLVIYFMVFYLFVLLFVVFMSNLFLIYLLKYFFKYFLFYFWHIFYYFFMFYCLSLVLFCFFSFLDLQLYQ